MHSICVTHGCLYMEQLHHVNWSNLCTDIPLLFRFCIDMCLAVAALHKANIAHTDIKSNAVMIRQVDKDEDANLDKDEDANLVLFSYDHGCFNANQECVNFGRAGWSHQHNQPLGAKKNNGHSLGLLLAYRITA